MFGFEEIFDFIKDDSAEQAMEFMIFDEVMNGNEDSEELSDEELDDLQEDEDDDDMNGDEGF